MSERERELIIFEGRVQGVGFRYKLSHLAEYYGVTGWVRNEYDGTVSAELQGQKGTIEMLLRSLGEDRYIRLDKITRKKKETLPEERGFHIRY